MSCVLLWRPEALDCKVLIPPEACSGLTPNLPTNMLDFRGFYSSSILNERGGILMSIGNFTESLSQAMLVGVM